MKRCVMLAVWLALGARVAVGAETAPPAKFGTLTRGAEVPGFALKEAGGKEVTLADFKGKPLVLGFFATNRPPADLLENAWGRYRELGVAVVGVCTNATREEFDAWMKKHGSAVTYPILWDAAGKNRAGSVAQRSTGVFVFPSTVVVDKDGKFIGGLVGAGANSAAVVRDYLRTAGAAIPADEAPKPVVSPPPRPDNTLKPGETAPDFAAIDLAGKTVKLADFAGKIVVLDFWATWCGPCIASMPHSQKIAAATKAQGVVIYAACTSDTRAAFEKWLGENGAKYPDLVFANDPRGRDDPEKYAERASAKLYGVSGIPCQFVIDRDGKIADVIRGFGPGDTRLEEALKRLGVTVKP